MIIWTLRLSHWNFTSHSFDWARFGPSKCHIILGCDRTHWASRSIQCIYPPIYFFHGNPHPQSVERRGTGQNGKPPYGCLVFIAVLYPKYQDCVCFNRCCRFGFLCPRESCGWGFMFCCCDTFHRVTCFQSNTFCIYVCDFRYMHSSVYCARPQTSVFEPCLFHFSFVTRHRFAKLLGWFMTSEVDCEARFCCLGLHSLKWCNVMNMRDAPSDEVPLLVFRE